jgi:uncharacterized protein YjbJ (UPF0337 family)
VYRPSQPVSGCDGTDPFLAAGAASATHQREERNMNWDRIEGNWKQAKGKITEQWGKLTDDDLDVIAGRRDQLAGKLQERYGMAKDEAEKQLASWERRVGDSWADERPR